MGDEGGLFYKIEAEAKAKAEEMQSCISNTKEGAYYNSPLLFLFENDFISVPGRNHNSPSS